MPARLVVTLHLQEQAPSSPALSGLDGAAPREGVSDAREQSSILKGLSDQAPGMWAPWDSAASADSPHMIFGVQREIAALTALADQLGDLVQESSARFSVRADEHTVEWLFADDFVAVDLTLMLAVLGRELQALQIAGQVRLETM